MELQGPKSPLSYTNIFDNPTGNNNAPENVSNSDSDTGGGSSRRSLSEGSFRISDDDICISPEIFQFAVEMDELFPSFVDVQNVGRNEGSGAAGFLIDGDNGGGGGGEGESEDIVRFRRRCSGQVGGIHSGKRANRAIPPEKLAEIWEADPRRVKRILSNRQSAARSKQRKVRHVLELEQKVQSLQSEARNLSAQLSFYQRDAMGLSSQNAELKIRLQAMEQQIQLRDALNEALKHDIDRLKIAKGDKKTPPPPTESFGFPFPPSPSTFKPAQCSQLPSRSMIQPIQCNPLPSFSALQTISYSAAGASPSASTVQSVMCGHVASSAPWHMLCSPTVSPSPQTTSLFPPPGKPVPILTQLSPYNALSPPLPSPGLQNNESLGSSLGPDVSENRSSIVNAASNGQFSYFVNGARLVDCSVIGSLSPGAEEIN